ncbi:hypothetical protein CEXT_761801 [Caerostris extrusa]|uniref:Uncharacterized protein n=1 Tax=Caerostris extrusa TaxID=172846 RepID=A0AAV4QGI5_CAEEX|nr:hypothetical protein CEXT_761801 [Caerostris extrusa]
MNDWLFWVLVQVGGRFLNDEDIRLLLFYEISFHPRQLSASKLHFSAAALVFRSILAAQLPFLLLSGYLGNRGSNDTLPKLN